MVRASLLRAAWAALAGRTGISPCRVAGRSPEARVARVRLAAGRIRLTRREAARPAPAWGTRRVRLPFLAGIRLSLIWLAGKLLTGKRLPLERLACNRLTVERLSLERLALVRLALVLLALIWLAGELLTGKRLSLERVSLEWLPLVRLPLVRLAGELAAGKRLTVERLSQEGLSLVRLAGELLLGELAGNRPREPRTRRAVAETRDVALGRGAERTGERRCPVRLLLIESGLPVSGVSQFRRALVGRAWTSTEPGFLRTAEAGCGTTALVARAGEALVR